MLKMERNGFVKGKIFATNVDIAGKVEGIIHCENLATLRNGADIKADIHTKSLQVDDGAQLKGQINMSPKGEIAGKK
jgi:cytoskeletal protein CcmA (bactofilin family)